MSSILRNPKKSGFYDNLWGGDVMHKPGVTSSKDFTPGYYLSAPTALSIFFAYGIPAASDFTDELSDSFGTHRFSKDG